MIDDLRSEEPEDQFPMGIRVLAVNDDPTCLKLLETLLRQCQYHVTATNQARTALEMLRENTNSFDLVISDVHMLDMEGTKLLELAGFEMDLPVIMLSANGDAKLVMKGISHGACAFLRKPVRIKELKNLWQHVIRCEKSCHFVWTVDLHKKFNSAVNQLSIDKAEPHNILDLMNVEELTCENVATHLQKYHALLTKISCGGQNQQAIMKGLTFCSAPNQFHRFQSPPSWLQSLVDDPSPQKKPRHFVWSVDLHKKFVSAVNQLGIDKAEPNKIFDLMNVKELTIENVTSHLQKYRGYLKRISCIQNQQPYYETLLRDKYSGLGIGKSALSTDFFLQFQRSNPALQSRLGGTQFDSASSLKTDTRRALTSSLVTKKAMKSYQGSYCFLVVALLIFLFSGFCFVILFTRETASSQLQISFAELTS